ncbi:hypothetical protein [Neglectibacter caecimuris]|uniref:hypothetical protein n=1 Tax=Neglectibacter caecimuris TaxID=3093658 RepID=UPI002AC981EF|nr:hypothetical protein [Neglectibacter sp. M00184]
MDITTATSAMRSSLLTRDVYAVCFPERDDLESLHGELAAARKKFFTRGKKAVRAGKNEVIKGFDGKLSGKLRRHGLYWKKTAGKIILEEAFDQRNGYAVVRRDFRGIIQSRIYFDKNHLWIKSEYYDPWDTAAAQVIFKPSDSFDVVERFDRETEHRRYRSTELHPLPYLSGTAEQSILNARFGEPGLIVSTAEGEFCYCAKKEAQARKRALEEIKDGTIVLMPAWEVKDGSLAGEAGEEETALTFTSLEEYAKVEPGQETEQKSPALPGPALSSDSEEFTTVPEVEEQKAPESSREERILAAARKAAGLPEAPQEQPASQENAVEPESGRASGGAYYGTVQNGKLTVAEQAGQKTGAAVYHGEYQNGKREGFGSHYYKDGSLCYAGFWKEDKRDGLGVSFREGDHALHIAKWENGKPGNLVSLFDKDGNLRYGGYMTDGKKQGAGVSFPQPDGTIFVGKWENGEFTGLGSSFDKEGNLVYYGAWKNGMRNGHGTEFDSSGGIVFDGEWQDGKYYNGILYQKRKETTEELPFPEES